MTGGPSNPSLGKSGFPDKVRETLERNGATDAKIDFLLGDDDHGPRRIELDALVSSRRFIDFIERKIAEHGISKVIPEAAALADAFRLSFRGRTIIERTFAASWRAWSTRRSMFRPILTSASAHSMIYRAIILALALGFAPRAFAVECRTERDHIRAGISWGECDDGTRWETWRSRIGGAERTEVESRSRASSEPQEDRR